MLTVRKHVSLKRQECAAAVDEVDASQPILERDLLRAKVLLDGERVVRAALDRRVVGDDHARRPLDLSDTRDDAGTGGLVVVQPVGGKRTQLEERAPRIEQALDPLSYRQLAPLSMSGDRPFVAASAATRNFCLASPKVRHEILRGRPIRHGLGSRRIDPASEDAHDPMMIRGANCRLPPSSDSVERRD